MSTIPITYWTDPLCIWAFVAQPRLDSIESEFEARVAVQHRIVPIFGSLPWRFDEGPWSAGGVEARVAATARVAAQHGFEGVTGAVWRDDTPASSWAPSMAIKAAFALEAQGGTEAGAAAAYQWALRRAFFEANVNIARRAAQLEVAEVVGLPRGPLEARLDDGSALAEVWRDHHDREASMIAGSPTWVFDGGRAKLYGNVDFGVLHATVEQLLLGDEVGCTHC